MPDCYKSAPLVTKVPYNVTKVPCCRYKSALVTLQKCPWLQKFPTLVTKVPYPVTKVPFFRYKSARSYGSLSLSLSLSLKVRAAIRFPFIPVYIGVPVVRMDSGRADVRSRDYQNFSDT